MPSLFAHSLFARQNPLDEARITLSSWDNCMAKAYCKWPVIVAIIIGGLILISVVTCIARCICCGAECACCCFRCCTCCCSGSGRGHKRVKSDPQAQYPTPYGAPPQPNPYAQNPYAQAHAAAPPAPPIDTRPVNQQYRSNAMPTFTPHAAAQPERPQFATFDSTRAFVNEDALPPMPTWKDGRDVHVQVEEQPVPQKQGDMELDRLDRNGSVTSGSMGGVAAAAVPTQRRSPGPGRSPVSPMDNYAYPQGGYQNDSFVSQGAPLNSQGGYSRPYAQQDEYRRGSPAQNSSPAYGAGDGYGQQQQQQQQPYDRRSPGTAQAYDSRDQLSQYNQQGPGTYGQQVPQTYDQRDYYDEQVDQRYQSPPPATNHYNNNNQPYTNDYTSNPSPSYHSNDNYHMNDNDTYTPPPAPPALQPGYPASQSTDHGSFTNAAPAYPGQRSYTPVGGSVAGVGGPQPQPYRAFSPLAQGEQGQQGYGGSGGGVGVQRKPVDGSFREI